VAIQSTNNPALLIDLDGVIYQGESLISGAAEAVKWINLHNIQHRYVTNTTSRSREKLRNKLGQLGVEVSLEDIFTPIMAALLWLNNKQIKNPALFVPENALSDFAGIGQPGSVAETGVDAIIVGDLGDEWDYSLLNRAFRLLMGKSRPQLVALGLTRYWRAADGLRLDVAPFIKALEYAASCQAIVVGKPSIDFFEMALNSFKKTPDTAIMIGDDIVSDIQGAQQAGLNAILVKTGKYSATDLQGDIKPDAILESISDLPEWWQSRFALASG
jgi:phospholysine phosphohistidine inorganic pyrophosphate phosphatase